MTGNWLEAAIIFVIMAGIGVAIFKGGAANPVSTGGLRNKLTALDSDLRDVKAKVGNVATRVAELEQRAATKGDIERVEKRLEEWDRKIDRLDERIDNIDRDLATLQAMAAANQQVIAAMAESVRETGASMGKIERQVDATAAITARVPDFIESVLSQMARTTARAEQNSAQIERLYDFLTEKALK